MVFETAKPIGEQRGGTMVPPRLKSSRLALPAGRGFAEQTFLTLFTGRKRSAQVKSAEIEKMTMSFSRNK
jgi:hypothetical protein